jgi:hypothetical protein
MIEQAMKDAHYSINPTKSSKQQALEVSWSYLKPLYWTSLVGEDISFFKLYRDPF